MTKITETMKTNKLFDLAYKLYPEVPGGYFDGEMIDGNSSARWAYIRGFEDAVKYLKSKNASVKNISGTASLNDADVLLDNAIATLGLDKIDGLLDNE